MSIHISHITRLDQSGHKHILDAISLTVEEGEFVALIGPSGAGKTSLLRVIAGLDQIEKGEISFDGQHVEALPPQERNIGFVFQNYALFPHMNVADNISFGLRLLPARSRPSKKEINQKVLKLLELMHLPHIADSYPHRLSGGQKQRVALARALATQPKVLLLDEPFAALDPLVRKNIRRWLRNLHTELGLTTILVTHDQSEAIEIADRLVVMQNGKITQTGHPHLLDTKPATTFIMEFMGETLTFPCSIKHNLVVPNNPSLLPFAAAVPEGPAEAMIRPYEIALVPGEGQARISRYEHRGEHLYLEIETEKDPLSIRIPYTAQTLPSGPIGIDISSARLFRNGHYLEETSQTGNTLVYSI
ncbi:sulfate/molybdate ABC transporter ATP-binding protein [Entomobacter blattae]|uniref:Vitamin B12 import ATP-binding protein BtuD n=1 Tax=Entomobacter blattae TaxID=2762277 RepID=A0A7H1NTV8_9PROT|nr:ATP-binding cassette domain-containing protein [Entomobacter blattae]QNT79218.1 Vitamin B12 import ATP-binding protein BtuD [Entomobacter blattae]